MRWKTSRLRALGFAIWAYYTARKKKHGAGPGSHAVGVMMAASYYSAIRRQPSRYWRKLMSSYRIVKVANHCYWIYKDGECLDTTWTSEIAAQRYIQQQTQRY